MDIDIDQLRAAFEPFNLLHLMALYLVLTLAIFLWALIVTASGSYPTARQFWKVHLILLGSVYALSAICFLLLNIDPLLLLLIQLLLSFMIQGHLGIRKEASPEDWWAFRFHRRQLEPEEEQK